MRRHNPPTPLATARRFVRHYLGKHCFAPFTGQDFSAWSAFVYACELYGRTDNRAACLVAMDSLLHSAQSKCAELFLWTIPAILDWGHTEEIWPEIGDGAESDKRADLVNMARRRERVRDDNAINEARERARREAQS